MNQSCPVFGKAKPCKRMLSTLKKYAKFTGTGIILQLYCNINSGDLKKLLVVVVVKGIVFGMEGLGFDSWLVKLDRIAHGWSPL